MKKILCGGGSVSLVVLAGGRSRRMGRDKARMSVPGGTLLARVVGPVAEMFDEVLIVASPGVILPAVPGRRVDDAVAGEGPLRGILTGLQAASNDVGFVLGGDMPGLAPGVVRKIVRRAASFEITVAATGPDGIEPLLGVYRKSVIPVIEALLAAGLRSVLDLFARARTGRILLGSGEIPPNINTPGDAAAWIGRLKGEELRARAAGRRKESGR